MSTSTTGDLSALRDEVATRIEPLVGSASAGAFEEQCRVYLQLLRWPSGVTCPRCEERDRILRLEARSKWHCYACRYQFSVTAGTLFHDSHLPVWKWLGAVHLMLESPAGISAGELRRRLGGSYKTAWFAAHRIRAAMRGRAEVLRRSMVEIETRSAVERPVLAPPRLEDGRRRPPSVAASDRPLSDPRAFVPGPHHHLSAKHLRAYLDEHRWRFVHRGNPHVFRDTIVALLGGERLRYVELVGGSWR